MDDGKQPVFYAQFEGDEIDGVFYSIGDPIKEGVDPGIITYLTNTGRISSAPPGSGTVVTREEATPVSTMNRASLLAELGEGQDDKVLRDAVERKRAMQAEQDEDERDALDEKPEPYEDIKDLPLSTMTTRRLNIVAEAEGVTFAEGDTTNAKRAAAIEAARVEKAKG